jgi:hypothetical protein
MTCHLYCESAKTAPQHPHSTISDIVGLSESGFSEIAAVARLAIIALDADPQAHAADVISALNLIWGHAERVENCILSEANAAGVTV